MSLDYSPKKLIKDNDTYFPLLKLIILNIIHGTLMKIILIVSFIIQLVFLLVETYFFINRSLSVQEFVAYGPFFFGTIYCQIAMGFLIIKNGSMKDFTQELDIWTSDSADDETFKTIQFEAIFMEYYCRVLFSFTLLALIMFMIPDERDKTNVFADYFALNFVPSDYQLLVRILYRSTFPMSGFSMISPFILGVYLLGHFRFQVMLFLRHWQRICDSNHLTRCDYQNEIKRRLIFMIQRHGHMIVVQRKQLTDLSIYIGFLSISCGFFGLAIVFYCFTANLLTLSLIYYARVVICLVISGLYGAGLSYIGQSLEDLIKDAMTNVFTQIEWYTFDLSNQKLFLTCLIGSSKTLRVSISENYAINYSLVLSGAKAIYSLISVIRQMKHFGSDFAS